MKRAIPMLAGLALALTSPPAHADTIFTDFGPGDSYSTSNAWVEAGPSNGNVPTSRVAMPFTVGGTKPEKNQESVTAPGAVFGLLIGNEPGHSRPSPASAKAGPAGGPGSLSLLDTAARRAD
jgi:hypothetical protein